VKPLSSYLDLAKISTLPASEIPTLWRLRHASSPTSLSFTLPASTWSAIAATARKHPQFILPLPRERSSSSSASSSSSSPTTSTPDAAPPSSSSPSEPNPIEIHFLQFAFPSPHATTLLFTHLAEYKLRGEFASPHTAVTVHTELADSHGLALGQGSVLEGRGVAVEDGQWLLMCLQKFYGLQAEKERGGRGRRLLEMFSEGHGGFRVEDLVEEAERV
jgi:ATP synthase mitochondrial F1 complex assembly factor 1